MASILLKDNLANPSDFRGLENLFAKPQTQADPERTLAKEIQRHVARGDIRSGDWLVYEDAGGVDRFVQPGTLPNDKDMYRRYRQALQDMVKEASRVISRDHIVMMTMFAYDPKCVWCKWDAPLDDGVHSGNDAIRDEAMAQGIRVIDMNGIMDRAEGYVKGIGWGQVVGPDGIHPNVYGNYVMALAILGTLGADVRQFKLDGLELYFRHSETGGDLKLVWGFMKDPQDSERKLILEDLRNIVARELRR